MTDLLVARLREAIDETARIAQAATPGPWRIVHEKYNGARIDGPDRDDRVVDNEGGAIPPGLPTMRHIVRHDPAAVLRRCAADRKILDLLDDVAGMEAQIDQEWGGGGSDEVYVSTQILTALAEYYMPELRGEPVRNLPAFGNSPEMEE